MLILMLGSISGMAGHDLMVHLAIHHQGPFGEENVPARFGVPLPWTEDPVPLDQMVLVGAESAQMRPVLYWPNGSIRWMLVDAILGVNPSQDRAAFQLTTGEQAPASTPIGRITDSNLEMHSGAVIVKPLGSVDGAVVLALEDVFHGTVAKIRFPFPAEVVPSSTDFVWSWDYNGPVAASMRLHHPFDWKGASFVHTIRCHLFAGQAGVVVEQQIRRRVTASDPSQDAVLFREEDGSWGIPRVELPEHWSSVGSQQPGVRQWRSAGDLRAFHVNQLQRAQAAAEPLDTIQMFPGSMARERTAFVFHPSGQAPGSCIPHIGRPISVNTYQDSQWHGGFLKQGDGSLSWEDVSDPSSMSIVSERVDHLVSGSLLPTPQTMQEMDALMVGLTQKASLDSLIVTANRMRDLSAYRLFYGLTGDTSMRVLWLEGLNNPLWQPFQPARLQAFWEACVMMPPQDPSVAREETTKATEVMEVLQHLPWASMPDEERSHLIPLLHQIWRQGGFPESVQGAWLDRMEVMIHELKSSHPSQELFAIGYLLTGERSFLKEGRQWLDAGEPASWNRTLEVLVESIQRQWTWRWLPLETSPVEEGIRVEWTVPKGVESYRFKSASQPIESTPSQEAGVLAFYQATDRLVSIPLKAEGTTQSVVLPASELAGDLFVAARYLERGPELPIPKTARDLASAAQDVTKEKSEEGGVDMRRLWMLGVLLLLALLALSAIRKKA